MGQNTNTNEIKSLTVSKIPCLRLSQPAAAWQPGCEEMGREWGNGEEMEGEWGNGERGEMEIERWNGERGGKWRQRDISSLSNSSISLHFLSFSLISSQYTTFLASVAKILTYALWGNNSKTKQPARKPYNLCRPAFMQNFVGHLCQKVPQRGSEASCNFANVSVTARWRW